jgi:hypothetical protein
VSIPSAKSDGKPIRNLLEGSKISLGRKNLRNATNQVAINPAMLHQTIRLRILLIGGSGVLSMTEPAGLDGFGTVFEAAVDGVLEATPTSVPTLAGATPGTSSFLVSTTPSVRTFSD